MEHYRFPLPEVAVEIPMPHRLSSEGLKIGQGFEILGTWLSGPGWDLTIETTKGDHIVMLTVRNKDKARCALIILNYLELS